MRTPGGLEKLARTVDGIGPWVNQLYDVDTREGMVTDNGLVQLAHAQGLVVHPYTYRVDALPPGFASFDALVEFSVRTLAVDGVFTDFPDAFLSALRRIS